MDRRHAAVEARGLVGTGVAVLLLTATCVAAVFRASATGGIGPVAFVIVSYGALLLLLASLRSYELAPPEAAAERERLKRRVWVLCTLLTALFAWKVAGAMPWWPAAVGVWIAAAATSAAGFAILFRGPRPHL